MKYLEERLKNLTELAFDSMLDQEHVACTKVAVKIKLETFKDLSKTRSFLVPIECPEIAFQTVKNLFHNVMSQHSKTKVRLVGVVLSGFTSDRNEMSTTLDSYFPPSAQEAIADDDEIEVTYEKIGKSFVSTINHVNLERKSSVKNKESPKGQLNEDKSVKGVDVASKSFISTINHVNLESKSKTKAIKKRKESSASNKKLLPRGQTNLNMFKRKSVQDANAVNSEIVISDDDVTPLWISISFNLYFKTGDNICPGLAYINLFIHLHQINTLNLKLTRGYLAFVEQTWI